jgi:hypothetical protein
MAGCHFLFLGIITIITMMVAENAVSFYAATVQNLYISSDCIHLWESI